MHQQEKNERCDDSPGRCTGTLHAHAFCRVVLRPSSAPRPAQFLAPPSFETLPEGPRRGGVPPLGHVTSRIRQSGEDAPPPPSFHSGDEGRTIRAGVIWARVLGGSFGREMSLRAFCCCHPRSFQPSRGDRVRTVHVENCELRRWWWRSCGRWRRGGNGVIVGVVIVGVVE